MLIRILTTAPLACVLSFGLAYAGDEQIAPKGEHAHGDKAEKLAKFDTNHDGKLDEGERAAMRAELSTRLKAKHPEMFAKIDTDHDGVLSKEEMHAGKKMLDEGERATMRAELSTRLKTKHPELFAKVDTDHDGVLSKEELHAGKKMLDDARETRDERKGKKEAGDK